MVRIFLSRLFFLFLQFIVYGFYFFLIGAVFLAIAVYSMTVIGWRVCWQQRYFQLISAEDDASETEDSSDVDDLQSSNPSVNNMLQSSSNFTEACPRSSKVI